MPAQQESEFRDFVAGRSRALLRTAYLLTGDHHLAEDLLQTALTKTYVSWHRIRDRAALDAYVRTTMVTTHLSWRRRRWRAERPTPTVPEHLHLSETNELADRDLLWGHILALPEKQRAVVVLRYYEDLSEAEIARILGCSAGTVKSHASRAMSALRAALGEDVATANGTNIKTGGAS